MFHFDFNEGNLEFDSASEIDSDEPPAPTPAPSARKR